MATNISLMAWIGFILSMLSTIITGINMAFNVYALPLKRTFNLTQTQVEILVSLDGFGLALGILEIPFFNTFGYKPTFLLSWILMPISSGFLSMASFYNLYFSNFPGLLYIAQFTMALGNAFVTMVTGRVLFQICPDSHTGKLVGLVLAMQCAGKLLFAGLMDLFFFTKLAGFFLTIAGASLGLFAITFVILFSLTKDFIDIDSSWRNDSQNTMTDLKTSQFGEKLDQRLIDSDLETSTSDERGLITDSNRKPINYGGQFQSNSVPVVCEENPRMTSIKDILLSGFFHLVVLPAALYYSVPFILMNNITVISDSMDFQNPMETVYIISIFIIATRIMVGIILDKFPSVLSGLVFLLLGDLIIAAALLLGMFLLNTKTVLHITILTGFGLGSGFTACAPMLLRRYGKQHATFIASFFYVIFNVCIFVNQIILGTVYDSKIERNEDIFCYGSDCFYNTFVMLLSIIVFVITIQATHLFYTFYHDRCKSNNVSQP